MKRYFDTGKGYGGVALTLCGLHFIISNSESVPFGICLIVTGIILLCFSFKKETSPYELFLFRCRSIIQEYESHLSFGSTSCEDVIIESIKAPLKKHPIEKDKIEQQAHTLVLNRCYSMLSSGIYHIHAGTLNVMGVAPSLRCVYEGCAKWLLDNNYLTKEQYDENRRQLQENIDSVG